MHPTTWGIQRERDDLAAFALSVALVPVTWLLLGWTWRLHIAGGDAVFQGLVTIRELIDAGGSWSRFVYRAAFLGGWKAETWDSDAVMKLFRERLLARLIERHAFSEEPRSRGGAPRLARTGQKRWIERHKR